MCFSATASFAAFGVLSILGLLSVRNAKTKQQIPFAAIPFLFGIQQFCEGVIWLTQSHGLPVKPFLALGTYGFLMFAFLVWPVWVPFSLLLLEKDTKRKQILAGLFGIGSIWALFVANFMIVSPITTSVVCCDHIQYLVGIGYPEWAILVYALATILPFFVSSVRLMTAFGLLVLATFIGAYLIFSMVFISVWCFFAAAISICVYWMVGVLPVSRGSSL
ncbi:MAG: DUF6629 family protein [Candidatus Babeliales bacterium]